MTTMLLLSCLVVYASKCNNAYTVLTTNENTWCAAHVVASSLLDTGTKSDIVIMYTNGYRQFLHNKVVYQKVMPARANGNGQWKSTYSKFWAGRLIRYDKVILLDADIIVLRNIDHLFNYTDGFAAPTAYWISPNIVSSGLIVMKPTSVLFTDVLEQAHGHRNDMDYFNLRHGSHTMHLDPTYNTLIGEWYPRDRIYHRIVNNISVVHFVAEWKPFSFTDWSVQLDRTGVEIYRMWWTYATALDLNNQCTGWKLVYSKYINAHL